MRRSLPLLLSALVVLVGCGIDEDVVAREAAEADPATTSAEAPPATTEPPPPAAAFTVGAPPEGYELLLSGAGETAPGRERPVTVLAPDGEPVGTGVVLVEVVVEADTGFVPDDEGRWASLTQAGDGDLGVRVWGVDADEADLAAVADAVAPPTDRRTAPVVDEPPAGLEVVGSIQADGVQGLAVGVPGKPDDPIPGPASAQVAVFLADASSLVVVALPAGSLDPAAVVTEVRDPRREIDQLRDAVAAEIEVGDETGVVTTVAEAGTGAVVRRDLAVTGPTGEVLVLISRGPEILDADALAAVATSITPS